MTLDEYIKLEEYCRSLGFITIVVKYPFSFCVRFPNSHHLNMLLDSCFYIGMDNPYLYIYKANVKFFSKKYYTINQRKTFYEGNISGISYELCKKTFTKAMLAFKKYSIKTKIKDIEKLFK